MQLKLTLILFIITFGTNAQQIKQTADAKASMEWFADAKLGIFIHTGIYAVNGVDESWSFYNLKLGYPEYMSQLKGYNMSKYDPASWAELIKQSGARYAVITTKHHDGVALFTTRQNKLNTIQSTPAKRDLIKPFFDELRKRNIKCGAYFSLIDWSHPEYPAFRKDSSRYDLTKDYNRWNRYRQFMQAQISEVGNYQPDLWWFDGDWEHSAEQWEAERIRTEIKLRNPNAIINGRLQGYGDYQTPEQNVPVSTPSFPWWELCMTINNNWGYQPTDIQWKSTYQILTIFTDVVSHGGNLLLDIGPKADGTIPPEQVKVLEEMGAWNQRNGEGVFGTRAGLPPGHFYGPTTLSKDSTNLYLFIQGKHSGEVVVKGLNNKILKAEVLGQNQSLSYQVVGKISWSKVPGLVFITLPEGVADPFITVIKLQLDGPVSLYRGHGGFN